MWTMCSLPAYTASDGGDWLSCPWIFWSPGVPLLVFQEVPVVHRPPDLMGRVVHVHHVQRALYSASAGVPSLC